MLSRISRKLYICFVVYEKEVFSVVRRRRHRSHRTGVSRQEAIPFQSKNIIKPPNRVSVTMNLAFTTFSWNSVILGHGVEDKRREKF